MGAALGGPLLECGYCGRDGQHLPDASSAGGPPLCRRACGAFESPGLDQAGCDPAGCVFDDTIQHLGDFERTAFRFAGSKNLAALRWVFVLGAKPEVRDSNGTTLLHVACRTGSLAIVKDLVRRGSALNLADSAGWTPLHVSSCMGRQDVSLYLLQTGARPQCKNNRGQTPEDLCSSPCTKEVVVSYDGRGGGGGGGSSSGGGRASSSSLAFPRRPSPAAAPAGFDAGFDAGGFGGGFASDGSVAECGSSLHFEPFFVPREAALSEPRSRDLLQQLGVQLFHRSPGHGVAFLVAVGVVRDYPVEINNFLIRVGADPLRFGEFLGEEFPIAQTLRLEFLNSLPLLGTGVVSALQVTLHEITMPTDLLKADRLLRGIAHFWWRQHEEEVAERKQEGRPVELPSAGSRGELSGLALQRALLGTDALHRLMFSTLMLHQWLKKHHMPLKEWVQLNTGIESGTTDVPVHVQTGIYKAIAENKALLSIGQRMRKPVVKADLEAWGYVQYAGRSQASHDGDSAAWPSATPRVLAAQGGVSSAGQSSPLPGGDLPGGGCGAVPMRSHAAGKAKARVSALSALAQPLDEATADGLGRGAAEEEVAWLTLRDWLLLLAPSAADDSPPYAFASLQHAVLREVDTAGKRLVLSTRGFGPSSVLPDEDCDDWLELCLLLGDGRFQPLEAPQLEVRFSREADFKSWLAHLSARCLDENQAHPPELRVGDARLPSRMDANWPEEPSHGRGGLRLPPKPPGDNGAPPDSAGGGGGGKADAGAAASQGDARLKQI